ncbi:MAG: hypothetical protein MUE72_10105 [Chitinophagaceae bacterium]|nr:hypothetical protein [Chitinophagaceae bacterium]
MNTKVRFAVLFTSFVSLILIISSITIYFLYANFRIEEYYTRINKETLASYNSFIENNSKGNNAKKNMSQSQQTLIDVASFSSTFINCT